MQLYGLLDGIAMLSPSQDRGVTGIVLDSRRAGKGDLFVALPGTRTDGRQHIAEAVQQGVAAVIYDNSDGFRIVSDAVPMIGVARLGEHLGTIADRFFGSPSRRMTVIGVTGTNGKTTCTQLIARALQASGRRCAVIGTLGNGFPDALQAGTHTTPDVLTLHGLLAEYLAAGASHVCMEVSSHALDQGRVGGVAFDIAVFTNLSRDHLDYHGDMEQYGLAKARLFGVDTLKAAVINIDDGFGKTLAEQLGKHVAVTRYGLNAGELRVTEVNPTHDGLRLVLLTPAGGLTTQTPFFGRFNAYNLMAVVGVLLDCALSLDEIAHLLQSIPTVPGRMERFSSAGAPMVVVDYAHTPDALEQVLTALREHTSAKLWCVFGCGGDRDRGKRPQMGAIAERLADVVILTDDNPRHEAPEIIVAEIAAGMQHRPRVIHSRVQAIAAAVREAVRDDIVLVAGKGHEDYQQFGDERVAYSDRDTVLSLLEEAA
jgi:UDP-N-acetylmuramoyl-L-alanyl-D-glutamate--2,6-diaminopimelate ligase